MRITYLFTALIFLVASCTPNPKSEEQESPDLTKVKLTISKGDIVLQLYNETHLHRDNFIKIVEDGVLDSLLFHRGEKPSSTCINSGGAQKKPCKLIKCRLEVADFSGLTAQAIPQDFYASTLLISFAIPAVLASKPNPPKPGELTKVRKKNNEYPLSIAPMHSTNLKP